MVDGLTLFVNEPKVSVGSTERRNCPFGDSNLNSIVEVVRKC